MNARIGRTGLAPSFVAKLWASAAAGAAIAWAIKLTLPALPPVSAAVLIVGPYGIAFLGMTFLLRIPEARSLFQSVARRLAAHTPQRPG